jgi:hypothetical protein
VLKASESSGEVTSLALVRLDGSVASGSAVTIQGDLIAINDIEIVRGVGATAGLIRSNNFVSGVSGWRIRGTGNAEFNDVTVRGSVFVTGGDAATETYADGVAASALDDALDNLSVTIRSATEPTERPNTDALRTGDVWIDTDNGDKPYSWNGSAFIAAYTEIDGGSITTGTVNTNRLNVNDILAVNASITATLTMGSGGIIVSNSSTGFKIENDRILFGENLGGSGAISEVTYEGLFLSSTVGTIGRFNFGEMLIATDIINPTTDKARLIFSNTAGSFTLHDENNNQVFGFTLSNGASRFYGGTSQNVRFDTGIEARGQLRIYDTDESNYANIAYADSTANRTYTIPNVAASDFVMSEGTQTINGAKTFGGNLTVEGNISANGELRVFNSTINYARIAYPDDASANRTYTIPFVSNSDFVMSEGTQTIDGAKTFGFGNLLLRNTGDTGSATINYGTASVNRTYTFAGAGGTVWTDGNLPITNAGPGSNTPTTRLIITLSGVQYRFDVQQL